MNRSVDIKLTDKDNAKFYIGEYELKMVDHFSIEGKAGSSPVVTFTVHCTDGLTVALNDGDIAIHGDNEHNKKGAFQKLADMKNHVDEVCQENVRVLHKIKRMVDQARDDAEEIKILEENIADIRHDLAEARVALKLLQEVQRNAR